PWILAVAAIGLALIPFNQGGNTFLVYAAAMAGVALRTRHAIALAAALGLAMAFEYAIVLRNLRVAAGVSGVSLLIMAIVLAGILFARVRARELAELRLTQDE